MVDAPLVNSQFKNIILLHSVTIVTKLLHSDVIQLGYTMATGLIIVQCSM